MKILVTGGIGNVGRKMVERLVKDGHEVKVIDRKVDGQAPEAAYAVCDITNFADVREQVRGQDAVIHLAAIPYPGGATGEEIFRINCAGTYNIYEAAAKEGIRRVVTASSINAFGYNYGIKVFPIQYLPIDEEHPGWTTDPYSFSKQITEEIAAYYWRREGISGVCFRLPWVYERNNDLASYGKEMNNRAQAAYNTLRSMSDGEQIALVQELVKKHDIQRALRLHEKPWDPANYDPEEDRREMETNPISMLMFGYTDFWGIISAEDSAQAFEKAILADYEGSHPLYVSESFNWIGAEAETLARLFFPSVTDRKRPLKGKECLVDFTAAKNLIGYNPEHSIREFFDD